jgi:Ni/Fe-hydrogenase 1 B-type cytochrome subunit
MTQLKSYVVWDASVRWFHWINLLCLIGLIAVGVAILNDKALGVTNDGKILLKTVHVLIGYVIWAFIGGQYARWRAILPGGRGYMGEVRAYIAGFRSGQPRQYLGHNPLGRIAVTCLLLLLLVQAVTGLVLAGTDLFYPPFGSWIAGWVAAPWVEPASLVPYANEMYDATAYEAMRAFRKPFITLHYYGLFVLLAFAAIHILAVVVTEIREGGNLVSAMFSGKKVLSETPEDQTKSS